MLPPNCKVVSCNVIYDRCLHLKIHDGGAGFCPHICASTCTDQRMAWPSGLAFVRPPQKWIGSRSLPVNPPHLQSALLPIRLAPWWSVAQASRNPLTPAFVFAICIRPHWPSHDLPCLRAESQKSLLCQILARFSALPNAALPRLRTPNSVNLPAITCSNRRPPVQHYIRITYGNPTHITARAQAGSS